MSDILYLGDTSLTTAAPYLAGVLTWSGWTFDYIASDVTVDEAALARPYRAYILSDYMSSRFPRELQKRMIERVADGAGLLMIGGWESYHGLGGDWDGTPVAEVLPVEIASQDDRVNCDHPVFVCPTGASHTVTAGFPWSERPPLIGGYNRFRAKKRAVTLLEAVACTASCEHGEIRLTPRGRDPLLVVDSFGTGRVASLATDVAPHWVGPWVDWGSGRVKAQGPGANEIEVGDLYARFVKQLVGWVGGW